MSQHQPSSTVPRLLLGARLSVSARSTLHPFVASTRSLVLRAPRPTCWAQFVSLCGRLGLALGATVGTK